MGAGTIVLIALVLLFVCRMSVFWLRVFCGLVLALASTFVFPSKGPEGLFLFWLGVFLLALFGGLIVLATRDLLGWYEAL